MIRTFEYENSPHITVGGKYMSCDDFFSKEIDSESFTKTLAGVNGKDVLDESKRVSFTYNNKFAINLPVDLGDESYEVIYENTLNDDGNWTLLKYEAGGFFNKHTDVYRT